MQYGGRKKCLLWGIKRLCFQFPRLIRIVRGVANDKKVQQKKRANQGNPRGQWKNENTLSNTHTHVHKWYKKVESAYSMACNWVRKRISKIELCNHTNVYCLYGHRCLNIFLFKENLIYVLLYSTSKTIVIWNWRKNWKLLRLVKLSFVFQFYISKPFELGSKIFA